MQKTCFIVDLERTLLLRALRKLRLLHADILHLAPCSLELVVPQLLRSLARFFVLLLAQELRAAARLLLLLPHRQLGEQLTTAGHECTTDL